MSALPSKADIAERDRQPEVRKWGRYLIFDWIGLGKGNSRVQAYLAHETLGAMPTKNGGSLMGKPMDQVKAFAASNALHYVRQLISIVGRYGTLDKEFTALMDHFKMLAGVNLVHVPYSGSYAADLLGGQVQVAFSPIPTVIEYIRDARLPPACCDRCDAGRGSA